MRVVSSRSNGTSTTVGNLRSKRWYGASRRRRRTHSGRPRRLYLDGTISEARRQPLVFRVVVCDQKPSTCQRLFSPTISNVARMEASVNGFRARGAETLAAISIKSYASTSEAGCENDTVKGGRRAQKSNHTPAAAASMRKTIRAQRGTRCERAANSTCSDGRKPELKSLRLKTDQYADLLRSSGVFACRRASASVPA